MALAIIKRPIGVNLNSAFSDCGISTDGGGTYFFTSAAHGINAGDYVYLKTPQERYNGFKYVSSVDSVAHTFRCADYPGGPNLPWQHRVIQADGTATFKRSLSTHNWNAAHLPIIYSLTNTKWPINTDDTVRTISTVTDSNGYCALTLSGDIKTTGSAAALQFIKITGSGGGGAFPSYDGVYQIISYTNDTTFTISLAYSNGVDLSVTSASIQYYYNNYVVSVQLWGGVNASHSVTDEKPYELLTTLSLIPDEDNTVQFSIHDIIRSQLELKNNLLLGTLPNNLDAWTQFYIEYAESYDTSDGTDLSTFIDTYASDQSTFEGYAVNAKLPFKNVYSGAMSEYVLGDSAKKFLTLFERPTIFPGQYFDISFINDALFQAFSNSELSTFLNKATSGTNFVLGATPTVTLLSSTDSTQTYAVVKRMVSGVKYRIAFSIANADGGAFYVVAGFLNSVLVTTDSDSLLFSGNTAYGYIDVTTTSVPSYVFLQTSNQAAFTQHFTINDYWIYPVDDSGFSDIILRQGSDDIEVTGLDEGVYRQELNDPSCNGKTTDITLYKSLIVPLPPPASWSNLSAPSAFATKTFTIFTNTTPGPASKAAYIPLDNTLSIGDVVTIVVTTNINIATPGTSDMSFSLWNAALNVSTSNQPTQVIPAAAGSNTYTFVLTVTGSGSTYIVLNGTLNSLGAGSTLTITIPETYNVFQSEEISETKTLDVNCECSNQNRYLSWLDPTGGFNYWNFTPKKDKGINIKETGTRKLNLFPTWPESGGEFSDSVEVQTYRTANKTELVRSQHLTSAQVQAIAGIKTSPLVQMVDSIYDKRTVIVDSDSFIVLRETDKLYTIQFTITYTNEVESQTA